MSDNKTVVYALDTNIASYILNGDLWRRSPLDVIKYLTNFSAILDEVGGFAGVGQSADVRRFMACYQWALGLEKKLFLPPTAVHELMNAQQVGL